ncbi:hypothetical protein OIU78_013797, partial [Salix suchowensis]
MKNWIRPQLKKGLATVRTLLFLLVFFIAVFIYSLWIDVSKFSVQKLTNVIIPQKYQTPIITRKLEFPLKLRHQKPNTNLSRQTTQKTFKTEDQEDISSKPECPNYFRWIHEDLRPWNATGISRDMVERAKTTAHFRLIIVEGKAYLDKYKKSIQTRDKFTIWGILQLLRRYPGKIPDLELMFDCDDRPVIQSSDYRGPNKTGPPPLFRYCGDKWTEDMVFPD